MNQRNMLWGWHLPPPATMTWGLAACLFSLLLFQMHVCVHTASSTLLSLSKIITWNSTVLLCSWQFCKEGQNVLLPSQLTSPFIFLLKCYYCLCFPDDTRIRVCAFLPHERCTQCCRLLVPQQEQLDRSQLQLNSNISKWHSGFFRDL